MKKKKLSPDYVGFFNKIESYLSTFHVHTTKILANIYTEHIERIELDYGYVWAIFTKNNKSQAEIKALKKQFHTALAEHKKHLKEIESIIDGIPD